MPSIFKKTAYIILCMLCAHAPLFAQGMPDTSVLSRKQPPSTKIQHSLAFSNFIGLQYDMRFRTPNKLTDFYLAVEGIPAGNYQHIGLQGGVLFGNWYGFSLGGGVALLGAKDDMTQSNNEYYKKNNLIVGFPVGIRYQPNYRSFFAQVNYVPMLNLTDGVTTAAYPQIQLGFSFGGKNPNFKRDTMPVPQGIQHSAYVQLANFGYGLAYDARFRTKIRWLDWAATASVGGFPMPKKENAGYPRSSSMGTSLGASAIFGKRAFSFELGVQGVLSYHEVENISSIDYKTGDYTYRESVYVKNSAVLLGGFRYQNPRGGVSAFANLTYGFSYNSLYVYDNLDGGIRLGLGYSLKTK